MPSVVPKALEHLIDELGNLPGVGARTAERYAYFLLRQETRVTNKIAEAIRNIHDGVSVCPITFALIDADQKVSPLQKNDCRR